MPLSDYLVTQEFIESSLIIAPFECCIQNTFYYMSPCIFGGEQCALKQETRGARVISHVTHAVPKDIYSHLFPIQRRNSYDFFV